MPKMILFLGSFKKHPICFFLMSALLLSFLPKQVEAWPFKRKKSSDFQSFFQDNLYKTLIKLGIKKESKKNRYIRITLKSIFSLYLAGGLYLIYLSSGEFAKLLLKFLKRVIDNNLAISEGDVSDFCVFVLLYLFFVLSWLPIYYLWGLPI